MVLILKLICTLTYLISHYVNEKNSIYTHRCWKNGGLILTYASRPFQWHYVTPQVS